MPSPSTSLTTHLLTLNPGAFKSATQSKFLELAKKRDTEERSIPKIALPRRALCAGLYPFRKFVASKYTVTGEGGE